MSEYQIPLHMEEEILKRLPVKSLISFRCVSKAWKSLIDSSEFIAAHSLHSHTQQQHLLVSYEDEQDEKKYACYIDDDTFPQQRSVINLPPPLSAKQFIHPYIVGSSRGLVCLYGWGPTSETLTTLIWNPSIRKYISMPTKSYVVGFGVCPVTNDPKIVSTAQPFWDVPGSGDVVTVYTLSSGKWRSLSTNLPTGRLRDSIRSVVTDRFIYWRAETRINVIMSFDVANDTFEVIDLPNTLAHHDPVFLDIKKLRESLVIIEYAENTCTVWMMEDGVQRLFTKLFTVDTIYDIVGFKKSGVPIMKVIEFVDDNGDELLYKLVVYEPTTIHTNVLEMCTFDSFYVNSYTETLLLLDVNSYTETLLLLGRSFCISY